MFSSSIPNSLRVGAARALAPLALGFGLMSSHAFASGINNGDIVVVRIGTGAGALTSASTAVFLDEYTPAGSFVQTIALPTATGGGNNPITNSGVATLEGFLNLSTNGQFLTQAGYGIAPGTASVASTTSAVAPRVIARVGLNGVVDTSTLLSGDTSYSGNNIRSATSVDGLEFWAAGTATAGADGGVRYISSLGGTTSLQLANAVTNTRVVTIQNGQLYVSTASGSFKGVNTIGTGTPTTSGQTTTLLPGFPSSTPSQYDYFFANANTLYVAEDGSSGATAGIEKWTFGGGTWTRAYTLTPSGVGCRSVSGYVVNGVATLFATTTETNANRVVTVTDTGASSSFTTVATGSSNTVLRGLRFIPCTTDTDGDGTPDCLDGCPNDANKTSPGQCGCGVVDVDSDGDGTADCVDGCPSDASKTAPGQCGCGVADTDTDGDGVADCNDGCPNDANKTSPGICGCGVSDADSDGDGTVDCLDGCPNDANKTSPGICGCGVSDVDSDGDGVADCNDGCPNDANKTSAGICGCGVSDVDSDGDGVADCNDGCPNDANKTAPGQCGCGIADTDTDGDGVADCNDGCPNDALKTAPGQCGCGNPDTDTDGDGVADCHDNCVNIANPGQEDCNQNGIGDVCDIASGYSLDANADSIPDDCQGSGVEYCFGDGSGAACPCGNTDGFHGGCKNSTGNGARLYDAGGTSFSSDNAVMTAIRLPHNKSGLLFMGKNQVSNPFGDGRLCISTSIKRFAIHSSGASGSFVQTNLVANSNGAILSGSTWNFQAWYRDPQGPCGGTFNLSNAVQITFN